MLADTCLEVARLIPPVASSDLDKEQEVVLLQFQEEPACFRHFLFEVSEQTDRLRATNLPSFSPPPPPLPTSCYLLNGLFPLQYQPVRNELLPSSSVPSPPWRDASAARRLAQSPARRPSGRAQTPAGVLVSKQKLLLGLNPEGGVFQHTHAGYADNIVTLELRAGGAGAPQ